MLQLTNVKYSISEKHKATTYARVARDANDTQEVLFFLSQRSQFTVDTSIRNIATGITASPHVSVHESKSIEKHILASMEKNPVAAHIFRKKDQAVTMDTKSTMKTQDAYVHVDRQLLFQRLLTVGTKNGELQNVVDHKLCHFPPALFESVNAIRSTIQSSLADALWCSEAAKLPGPLETVQYVFDGGAHLLSCIVSHGQEETHMTRSLSNTVRMSLRSMAEQLLCLMGTVTNQAPMTVLI